MNPWRLRIDEEERDRSRNDRSIRRSKPGVESLEGRTLLSTTTTGPLRNANQPAAYKPPTQAPPTFVPYDIHPMILSPTDGGGSNSIFQENVEIGGVAFPYSTVWLAQGLRPGYFTNIGQANALGQYALTVPVGYGSTVIQVFAENSKDNYSNIDDVTVNRGNAVEAWDAIALHAIAVQDLSSPLAARDLAVLHSAQYDAVEDIASPASADQVHLTPPKGASAEAAADSAAYTALTSLFPSQAPLFVAAEKTAVAGLAQNSTTESSLSFGQAVANQTLANRANDGSTSTATFAGSTSTGLWRPTPPTFSPAIAPQFASVKPFEIGSPSKFRPAAPPSVGSTTYDQALSQVSALGRLGSTTRTLSQTNAAIFWSGGGSPTTDPAHWNAIAEQVTIGRKDSLAADARLFAQLDFALADASIAASDSQYTFDEWRPITAVQMTDPTFQPLLNTPASPSYVSDNAAYAAAASKVLTSALGSSVKFTDDSTGVARTFTSFANAATEDAQSRVWGGVNFEFDAQAGVNLGNQVGQAVLDGFPKAK